MGESMKSAIAKAAGAMTSRVHVEIQSKGSSKEGVKVGFSVEAERIEDANAIAGKLTNPSLVAHVAELASVDVKRIAVEANARALNEVLLSLGWTNPSSGKDYLDGSCLVYAGDELLEVVDYRGPQSLHPGKSRTYGWSAGKGPQASIVHSGDVLSAN